MLVRITAIAGLAGLAMAAIMAATPAMALSSHDCSVKFKAAQDAGTAKDMKYADFRKANCGADATADAPAATTPVKPAPTMAPAKPTAAKPAPATTAATEDSEPTPDNMATEPPAPAPTTVTPKGVVFPKVVNPKYSTLSAGKARMETCLDQYHANKANNALGGLKWIQKGGGYYSLCNAKLKAS